MVVVGILVVLAIGRVLGDVVRFAYPLSYFGYTTDGNSVVVTVPAPSPKPKPKPGATALPENTQPLPRLPPWTGSASATACAWTASTPVDRKPGINGRRTFTYDNSDRCLPIERDGRERVIHLVARREQAPARYTDLLRILLCIAGSRPGGDAVSDQAEHRHRGVLRVQPRARSKRRRHTSTSHADAVAANTPSSIDDAIRGFVRPALLLFCFCLIDGDADQPRERVFAWFAGALAVVMGALHPPMRSGR